MGIGASIVLIATGAILRWAVRDDVSGVNLHTVGLILLIVGIVGLLASLLFWGPWAGGSRYRRRAYRDGRVVEERSDVY